MNREEKDDMDTDIGDVQVVEMEGGGDDIEMEAVRTRLPDIGGKIELRIGSFLKQLKQAIGKDLASIRLPIELNEPLSFLQRLAEDVEYSGLFDRAAECADAHERLMWVTVGIISHYNSTEGRMTKPFNPLLGETYELNTANLRFVAEQVSHHPPISACYCEAIDGAWKYYNTIHVVSKFHANSVTVNPIGLNFVEIPKYGDVYAFNQVTSCVHNLFTGVTAGRWLENYGTMNIVNRATGDSSEVKFRKYSNYPRKRPFAVVKATIKDSTGVPVGIYLGGKWNRKIYREDKHGNNKPAEPLWEKLARPSRELTNGYHWTQWSIRLNEPYALGDKVCPTDSRLRPDQRALENGQIERAKALKHALEERQRERRRKMDMNMNIEDEHTGTTTTTTNSSTHEPLWFDKTVDEASGEEYYKFNGEYMKAKEANDWRKYTGKGIDIFECDEGE